MKWLFCALLIVNVAVLLWPAGEKRSFSGIFSGEPVQGDTGFGGGVVGDPAINPKDLILLSEKIAVDTVESSQYSPQQALATNTASTEPAESSAETQSAETVVDQPGQSEQQVAAVAESRHCLRIGPFFKEDQKVAARDFVASFEVPVGVQVVDERSVRSWRAFLGPFQDGEALQDAQSRARKAGFAKLRPLAEGQGRQIVSLGLFTTEKSAERVLGKTRFSTLSVNIREEMTRLPSTSWLEVSEPGVTIHELRMIDRTDWGERQVNVREIICAG